MSVLGVVVRVHPKNLGAVKQRLARTPGVDLGPDAGDGRLIAVIESTAADPAAAIMAEVTRWPEVLNLSLVFEQSDGDAPENTPEFDFRAWRGHVGEFARRQAGASPVSVSTASTSVNEGAGEA
ncbi:MAG: chaperone NapD [Burkholderiales bacterium]|nr:chaperone NapD [Burkholderiales bacterium]MBK8664654.1 chaperone NapD [Burkholderiales bacterium]